MAKHEILPIMRVEKLGYFVENRFGGMANAFIVQYKLFYFGKKTFGRIDEHLREKFEK